MDKLRSMETFVAVVDAGSFTEAAMQLEMSAVMVGKYVRELETRLGRGCCSAAHAARA